MNDTAPARGRHRTPKLADIHATAALVGAFLDARPGVTPVLLKGEQPRHVRGDVFATLIDTGMITPRGRVTYLGRAEMRGLHAYNTGRAFVAAGYTGLWNDMGPKNWETLIQRAQLAHAGYAYGERSLVTAQRLSLAARRTMVNRFAWSAPTAPVPLVARNSRFNPSVGHVNRLIDLGLAAHNHDDPDGAPVVFTDFGRDVFMHIDPDRYAADLMTARWSRDIGTMTRSQHADMVMTTQAYHSRQV